MGRGECRLQCHGIGCRGRALVYWTSRFSSSVQFCDDAICGACRRRFRLPLRRSGRHQGPCRKLESHARSEHANSNNTCGRPATKCRAGLHRDCNHLPASG